MRCTCIATAKMRAFLSLSFSGRVAEGGSEGAIESHALRLRRPSIGRSADFTRSPPLSKRRARAAPCLFLCSAPARCCGQKMQVTDGWTTRRSGKNWTVRGGSPAADRIRSDRRQIRMLSLSHDPPHIHTCSRAAKARRLPATWSVVACTQPVRPFAEGEREREREDGSETEHIFTFLRFLRTAATSGNLRWSHERLTRLWCA